MAMEPEACIAPPEGNGEPPSQTHANDRKLTQTHANANARKRSLRLTRGRFLRANAIAFCALDLKLSGCTIYVD